MPSVLSEKDRRAAVSTNYAERAPREPKGEQIWAYTDRVSYVPGETVRVHLNATVPIVEAIVTRDGAAPFQTFRLTGIAARFHPTRDDCSVEGCDWPVGFEIATGADWPSGAYRLTLRADEATYDHLFILRPAAGDKTGRLLLVAATNTWNAYNDWGGSNHYEGFTGPDGNLYSPVLSPLRPYARGFVSLPEEAPRIALTTPPPMNAPPRYPHMEWAFANGYSKKYASAGWASYDRPFVVWAEGQGYAIDIIAQADLHYRPEILEDYGCVVAGIGHDEYWTWEMRDAIDSYAERGGRVARFAGNFMWQIRLEDEGRRQICYKYRARAEDPLYGTERQHLTTESWEAPQIGRPGSLTFGLNATRGLYAGWGGCAPRGVGGFTIYWPEHWAFAGTGLHWGDVLGAASTIFGYEVDGLDYEIRDHLPYPKPGQAIPDGLEILGLGLSTLIEEGNDPAALFIGRDEVDYVARMTFGDIGPDSTAKLARGAGMIVSFPRGRGEVFHGGSCEWVAGLIRADPFVEKVTRNVLDRFLRFDRNAKPG